MIVLYSNHCPKCDILKTKLDSKNISYTIMDDEKWLAENGFDEMPILEVNGERLNYRAANDYINRLQ